MTKDFSSYFQVDGQRLIVTSEMTLQQAVGLDESGCKWLSSHKGSITIDLAVVTKVDSSALCVIMNWLRKFVGLENSKSIKIINAPVELIALAELYGIDELFGLMHRGH